MSMSGRPGSGLTRTYHYLVITPRLAVVLFWHNPSMLDVASLNTL